MLSFVKFLTLLVFWNLAWIMMRFFLSLLFKISMISFPKVIFPKLSLVLILIRPVIFAPFSMLLKQGEDEDPVHVAQVSILADYSGLASIDDLDDITIPVI